MDWNLKAPSWDLVDHVDKATTLQQNIGTKEEQNRFGVYRMKVKTSFGAAFCSAIVGIVVLLFGKENDFGGAVREGHETRSRDHPGALNSKESFSV